MTRPTAKMMPEKVVTGTPFDLLMYAKERMGTITDEEKAANAVREEIGAMDKEQFEKSKFKGMPTEEYLKAIGLTPVLDDMDEYIRGLIDALTVWRNRPQDKAIIEHANSEEVRGTLYKIGYSDGVRMLDDITGQLEARYATKELENISEQGPIFNEDGSRSMGVMSLEDLQAMLDHNPRN